MYYHEMTDKGSHRITVKADNGARKGEWIATGEYVGYQNIASLLVGSTIAIAVTEYFSGGLLEPGKVYFATKQKD